MKLIIDISEEDYEWVCEQNMGFELYKMIANGTPLTESDDCVSREAILNELSKWDWQDLYLPIYFKELIIDELPSVQPKRNKGDEEVIKETVASVWGKPPYTEVLDKIRAEIIQMPTISFNANDIYKADVLAIINKYKAESEDKE